MSGRSLPRPVALCSRALRIGLLAMALVGGSMLYGAPPALAADDPGAAEVYTSGKLWPIHITLTPEEYAAIEPRNAPGLFNFGGTPKNQGKPVREMHRNNFGMDLPWGAGAITVGDMTFANVGIRYKGNGTIGDASRTIKKSFKIDLDRTGGKGKFAGSKTINLHCGVADPSKCRETLGYEIYRSAGVPASRTAFALVELTVKGKYDRERLGIYTIVEEVGKPFLKDHFGTDAGLLMKPEGLRDFSYLGENWDRYKKAHAPKREATPAEAKRMIAWAQLVDKADDATFNKEVGSYLDLDAYLRFLAATAFVANSDSFFVLGHNFCLYLHPETNRLNFIPWDLDRAFANFPILGSNKQQMNLSFSHPYPGPHRLTDRVLKVPGVQAKYEALLKELAAVCFDKTRLLKAVEAADRAVSDHLAKDLKSAAARKEGGPGAPGGPPAIFGTPPALKTFMAKRTESLAAQIAGTSKGHLPTGGGGMPRIAVIMGPPVLESLDKDQDEKVSQDEWLEGIKRLLGAAKQDQDGQVDRKALTEGLNKLFAPAPNNGPAFDLGNYLVGPILTRADDNKNGKVTSAELMGAATRMFLEFDHDKSGKLDEGAFIEMLNAVFTPPKAGTSPPAETKQEKK